MKKWFLFYCLVWLLSVASFWTVFYNWDPIGYSIIFFWLVIPLASIVATMVTCAEGDSIFGGLLCVPIYGLFYALAYYFTFSLANMIAMDRINKLSYHDLYTGVGIALVGFVVGLIIRAFKRRRI